MDDILEQRSDLNHSCHLFGILDITWIVEIPISSEDRRCCQHVSVLLCPGFGLTEVMHPELCIKLFFILPKFHQKKTAGLQLF